MGFLVPLVKILKGNIPFYLQVKVKQTEKKKKPNSSCRHKIGEDSGQTAAFMSREKTCKYVITAYLKRYSRA